MSNPTDNSNNRNLKELLDKAEQPGNLPADDFEKDALEGFSMLEPGEAMGLKEVLDSKIYKEVFTKEKPKTNYWLAAAALALVISFSVYFIKNNSMVETKDVAITTVPQKEEPVASDLAPPPPVESPLAEPPPKAKVITSAEPASARSTLREAKPAAEPASADGMGISKKDETKFIAAGNSVPAKPALAPPTMQATEDMNSADVVATPVKEAEEKVVLEESSKKSSTQRESEPMLSAPVLKNQTINASSPQISASGAATYSFNSSSNTAYSPSAANSPTLVPNVVITPVIVPAYKGGSAALKKDVKEKLAAKGLVQKFDAVLVINKSNVVEKVKLTKTYGLTKEQQQQVIEILKTLNKFSVDASVKKTSEYSLVFRP